MKYKGFIITVIAMTAALILFFFPIRRDRADGGLEYCALTYRVTLKQPITDMDLLEDNLIIDIFPNHFK